MAVEMIIDQWNPSNRRYRAEPFCYALVPVLSTDPDRRARFPAVVE
jgi:hypothetical protein